MPKPMPATPTPMTKARPSICQGEKRLLRMRPYAPNVTESRMKVLATMETPAFDEALLVAKYSATRHFTSSPKPATAAANVTLAFLGLGFTGREVDRDLLTSRGYP